MSITVKQKSTHMPWLLLVYERFWFSFPNWDVILRFKNTKVIISLEHKCMIVDPQVGFLMQRKNTYMGLPT